MTDYEKLKELIRIPSSNLSNDDVKLKGILLSRYNVLDLENDDLEYRYFLGKVTGRLLIPLMTEILPIRLSDNLLLFVENNDVILGKCEVYKDGMPKSLIFEIEMIGG